MQAKLERLVSTMAVSVLPADPLELPTDRARLPVAHSPTFPLTGTPREAGTPEGADVDVLVEEGAVVVVEVGVVVGAVVEDEVGAAVEDGLDDEWGAEEGGADEWGADEWDPHPANTRAKRTRPAGGATSGTGRDWRRSVTFVSTCGMVGGGGKGEAPPGR